MNEKHRTIRNFDSAAFALAGGIGPWLAPLAPALVFGSAFSHSMWAQLGWLAVAGINYENENPSAHTKLSICLICSRSQLRFSSIFERRSLTSEEEYENTNQPFSYLRGTHSFP